MCLMLYIGTAGEMPVEPSRDLRLEPVPADRRGVAQWFSQPVVRFAGSHTGCSCGFPSVIAETRIDYYDGMSLDSDDREADLRSVRALVNLLRREVEASGRVELYPVADGSETTPPKGTIEWQVGSIDPERFFFNEQFLHIVRG